MFDFFKKDGLKVLIPRLVNFITGTIILYFIGKSWGASGSGLYSVVVTFFVLTSQMAIFGLDSLLLHHVGEKKYPPSFFGTVLTFHIFIISPIIFILFYLFRDFLKFDFISEQSVLLLILALIFNVAIILFNFLKLSNRELTLYASSVIMKPLLQLIFVLLYVFNIHEIDIVNVVIYPIIITFTVHLFFIIKSLNFKINRDFFRKWKEIISQGKWIYFSSIVFLLNSKGIILITNKYGSLDNVGVLFIAISALDILSYVSNAYGDISQIDMASLPILEKFKKLKNDYVHILKINGVIGLISLPITYYLFPLINADFKESFPIYAIILPSYILISSSKMMSVFFISLKKAHYGTFSVIFTLVTILLFSLLLVGRYGVLGAGISVSIGYLVSTSIDYVLVIKVVGLKNIIEIFKENN